MLFGGNDISVSEATMTVIVQYYLDNKFLNKKERAPTVARVQYDEDSGRFCFSMKEEEK